MSFSVLDIAAMCEATQSASLPILLPHERFACRSTAGSRAFYGKEPGRLLLKRVRPLSQVSLLVAGSIGVRKAKRSHYENTQCFIESPLVCVCVLLKLSTLERSEMSDGTDNLVKTIERALILFSSLVEASSLESFILGNEVFCVKFSFMCTQMMTENLNVSSNWREFGEGRCQPGEVLCPGAMSHRFSKSPVNFVM